MNYSYILHTPEKNLTITQNIDIFSEASEKTIVCGHIPTHAAYAFAPDWNLSDSGIYYGDGVIAVNGGVESRGKINVLILAES